MIPQRMRLRVPMPQAQISQNQPRPLLVIMRQPTFAVAMFGAASGGGVMVLAMTAMPLAMAQHHHGLSATTVVMQVHVLGMFLPSFFTGSLIARFGVLRVMFAGAVLLSAHVGLSLSGTGFVSFASALALLGVGWNFLYVGGTTLLTDAYLPAERGRAQAANDLLIFVVGLASSLTSGAWPPSRESRKIFGRTFDYSAALHIEHSYCVQQSAGVRYARDEATDLT